MQVAIFAIHDLLFALVRLEEGDRSLDYLVH